MSDHSDARLASEGAREQGASAPCGTCGATPETGISEGCLECEGFAPPALPSPSGPDAETLAAPSAVLMLAKRRLAKPNGDWSINDWRAVASGLVALVEQLTEQSTERLWRLNNAEALVEQRERERDELWKRGFAERERAEKAETLLARHRQALERIAAHPHGGILVNIARRALSASARGTEEQ